MELSLSQVLEIIESQSKRSQMLAAKKLYHRSQLRQGRERGRSERVYQVMGHRRITRLSDRQGSVEKGRKGDDGRETRMNASFIDVESGGWLCTHLTRSGGAIPGRAGRNTEIIFEFQLL